MSTVGPQHYLARLQSVIDGLDRDVRTSSRELDESQTSRAQDARTGRLGGDWKAVQRRIDAGRTSLSAVFAGGDDTPEARRLRELSRQNITQLAVEFDPPAAVQSDLAAAEEEWARLAGGVTPSDER